MQVRLVGWPRKAAVFDIGNRDDNHDPNLGHGYETRFPGEAPSSLANQAPYRAEIFKRFLQLWKTKQIPDPRASPSSSSSSSSTASDEKENKQSTMCGDLPLLWRDEHYNDFRKWEDATQWGFQKTTPNDFLRLGLNDQDPGFDKVVSELEYILFPSTNLSSTGSS